MIDLLGAVEEFKNEHQYRGTSPSTLDFYAGNIDRFMRDRNVTDLAGWNHQNMLAWLVHKKSTTKPASVRTYHRALKVFSRWLYHRGYIPEDIFKHLPAPRDPREKPEPFTKEEILLIIEACKQSRYPGRDYAIVCLLLDTGMRVGELVNLKLPDIDWVNRVFSITGKTGSRLVPCSKETMKVIRRYVDAQRTAHSPVERSLFLSKQRGELTATAAGQIIRRICISAGIEQKKRGPHTFRHTFSYLFLEAGGNVFHLQAILGHRTLSMTERYVKTGRKELSRTHEQFSPVRNLL